MKLNDTLKAINRLYSSFPVKENLITEGKYYVVIEMDADTFTVFDDTNHSRTFFNIEYNEMFVNFTDDLLDFIKFLKVSIKLNKNMTLRVYDYKIKQYKSFTMKSIENLQYPNGKQFTSLIIKGENYKASLSCTHVLDMLKARFGLWQATGMDWTKSKYRKILWSNSIYYFKLTTGTYTIYNKSL